MPQKISLMIKHNRITRVDCDTVPLHHQIIVRVFHFNEIEQDKKKKKKPSLQNLEENEICYKRTLFIYLKKQTFLYCSYTMNKQFIFWLVFYKIEGAMPNKRNIQTSPDQFELILFS